MVKVLILGGGFGGIRCALDLKKKLKDKAKVQLIDRNGYHVFTPDLYEVASAYGVKKDPFAVRLKKTICIPYGDIFDGKKVDFMQAEIASVDLEGKKVMTSGGELLAYDYLVLALGSQASDFGIPGVKEYAYQFKTIEDGLALNQKLDEMAKAIASGDKKPPIEVAVVGAGFTGIELAAELACCVKKIGRVCGIKGRCERIMLLEAAPKILPAVSDKKRKIVMDRLTQLGIEVMENAAAENIVDDSITLKTGQRVHADIIVWTAGVQPASLVGSIMGLPKTDRGKIKIKETLQVNGLSHVFAIGDPAEMIDTRTGKAVPGLAYVAVDQGKTAAENISRTLKNKKLRSYDPYYSIWIAPVGGKFALAHLWGDIKLSGFWGWVIRELTDLKYMMSILSFKKAVSLMWQEVSLFTRND